MSMRYAGRRWHATRNSSFCVRRRIRPAGIGEEALLADAEPAPVARGLDGYRVLHSQFQRTQLEAIMYGMVPVERQRLQGELDAQKNKLPRGVRSIEEVR